MMINTALKDIFDHKDFKDLNNSLRFFLGKILSMVAMLAGIIYTIVNALNDRSTIVIVLDVFILFVAVVTYIINTRARSQIGNYFMVAGLAIAANILFTFGCVDISNIVWFMIMPIVYSVFFDKKIVNILNTIQVAYVLAYYSFNYNRLIQNFGNIAVLFSVIGAYVIIWVLTYFFNFSKEIYYDAIYSFANVKRENDKIMQNSNDFIFSIDKNSKLLSASDSLKELLKDVSEINIGDDAREFVYNSISLDVREDVIEWFRKIKTDQVYSEHVFENLFKGKGIAVKLSVTPLYDDNKEFDGHIIIGQDVTEKLSEEKRIKFCAFYDTLTELPNRKQLFEYLDIETEQNVAGAFFDFNNFKDINDTFGHSEGDQCLVRFSNILREEIYNLSENRIDTMVARISGDEFFAVFKEYNSKEIIIKTITTIIERYSKFCVESYHVDDVDFGVSVGIAFSSKKNRELLNMADIAMYHAKNNKIDYTIYKDGMSMPKKAR